MEILKFESGRKERRGDPEGEWVMTVMPYGVPMWVALMGAFSCAGFAQDGPLAFISPRSPAPLARADFRLESDLVLIPVSVTDSKNHP